MLDTVPNFVAIVFVLTTIWTLFLTWQILKAGGITGLLTRKIIGGIILWLTIHLAVSIAGIYRQTVDQIPPTFILVVLPTFVLMAVIFSTKGGRSFIDRLPLLNLTYLSVVRIPVELVLYWLFVYKAIPELMTFSGRNFDILAGITAPFIAYFGIQKGRLNRSLLLTWNVIGLGLLLFIIGNALLSAPTFIQKFAFDQPNVGLLHFPFVWLAAYVAPVVLFSHLISIRQLLNRKIK